MSTPQQVSDGTGTSTRHPLDPLTAGEFREIAAVLRRDRMTGPGWRFASIELESRPRAIRPRPGKRWRPAGTAATARPIRPWWR